jgi:hypothetical protein
MLPQDLDDTLGPDKPEHADKTGEGASSINVYVDDYLLAVIEDQARTLLRQIIRATLYGVHSIFPLPEITNHEGGKDLISIKNMEKGDAKFMPRKIVLGFLLNGKKQTVPFPPDKAEKIITDMHRLLKKKPQPIQTFPVNGKACIQRHPNLASSEGFYDPVVQGNSGRNAKMIGLGKHSECRAALAGLRQIIRSLGVQETHVSELVQLTPRSAGT